MFTRKIELEKREIAELKREIADKKKKHEIQHRRLGGINAAHDTAVAVEKQTRILEDRLNKTKQKYNMCLEENTKIRKKIDQQRRQRMVYDKIYAKLQLDLQQMNAQMSATIQESKEAYEERDKSQQEISQLKEIIEKEKEQFDHEWKILGKQIESSSQLTGALKLAEEQKKTEQQEEIQQKLEQEKALKKKVLKARWAVANEKAHLALTQERLRDYQEAFKKITESTGETNIDKIVQSFIDTEKNIDWEVKQVNAINIETQKYQNEISVVQHEIDKYKGQGDSHSSQRAKILKEQEETVAHMRLKTKEYEQRRDHAREVVSTISDGIHQVFKRIGAGSSDMGELLGSQGITDSNVMQYLGLIEQRVNSILQTYAAQNVVKDDGQPNQNIAEFLGQGPSVPMGMSKAHLNVLPPGISEFKNIEDPDVEDSLPMNMTQLQANLDTFYSNRNKGKGFDDDDDDDDEDDDSNLL